MMIYADYAAVAFVVIMALAMFFYTLRHTS
jgi:hypothetical protein